MFITQITSVKSLQPILPGSEGDLKIDKGEFTIFPHPKPKKPKEHSKGRALVSIKVINGEIEEDQDLFLVYSGSFKTKVLGFKKKLLGGYLLDLYFDQIFGHGFENFMAIYLKPGAGLVGLSKKEEAQKNSYQGQFDYFIQLADVILTTKKYELKKLAKPFLNIGIGGHCDGQKSHFLGAAKLGEHQELPVNPNGIPLFHLATINSEDLTQLFEGGLPKAVLPFLSFYIDIEGTENGWPEAKGRFKVFNYAQKRTIIVSNEFIEKEREMLFSNELSLPSFDASVLLNLNLDDQQQAEFEALETAFEALVDRPDCERNQVWGHAGQVQGCVCYFAEMQFSGRGYSDENKEKAENWQLLLQISPYAPGSDFEFFKKFGDGTIYFVIQKKDFEAGNFDEVQVVVQNT